MPALTSLAWMHCGQCTPHQCLERLAVVAPLHRTKLQLMQTGGSFQVGAKTTVTRGFGMQKRPPALLSPPGGLFHIRRHYGESVVNTEIYKTPFPDSRDADVKNQASYTQGGVGTTITENCCWSESCQSPPEHSPHLITSGIHTCT